eukprot:352965-Chlamydomonas_euryale.AAC.20
MRGTGEGRGESQSSGAVWGGWRGGDGVACTGDTFCRILHLVCIDFYKGFVFSVQAPEMTPLVAAMCAYACACAPCCQRLLQPGWPVATPHAHRASDATLTPAFAPSAPQHE